MAEDPPPLADAWKFLHAAPPHYVAAKLLPHQTIALDGRLDEPAWSAPGIEWTAPFVDITRHANGTLNKVPHTFATRAKMRWDENYLYVGVELNEPFITANITGHNGPNPPYHDNDFEVRAASHREPSSPPRAPSRARLAPTWRAGVHRPIRHDAALQGV
jgi:hypothetical protein